MFKYFLIVLFLFSMAHAHAIGLLGALNTPGRHAEVTLSYLRVDEDQTPQTVINHAQTLVTPRLQEIRRSRLIFTYEVASPRDRMPIYCYDTCSCIYREIAPILRNHYTVRKLTVRVSRRSMEVGIRNHRGEVPFFTSHIVTVVKLQNRWFVIDPIMVGNAKPERLAVWLQRIEHPETLNAHLD